MSGTALESRVALVTGAGRGLGRAVAVTLATEGADLALFGRTPRDLEETARQVRALGRRALPVRVDVSVRDQVAEAVEQVSGTFGPIDVLINNAAVVTPIGPLAEIDPEQWAQALAVNLLGTVYCTHSVLGEMIERRDGRIVNISGGGAATPRPGLSAYAASKSALVRLTETVAAEVAPYGIRVNAVAPGRLPTQMLATLDGVEPPASGSVDALDRAAALVAFLASDAAGSLTGKLVSAVHDPWRTFGARGDELNAGSLYTLRRLDPFTIATAPPTGG